MNPYAMLALAIGLELLGTFALKASEGFTRMGPTVTTGLAYAGAFWLMALTVRELPLGTVYGVWAGVGIAGTAAIGAIVFKDQLTLIDVAGIALIITGVVLLTVISGRGAHA